MALKSNALVRTTVLIPASEARLSAEKPSPAHTGEVPQNNGRKEPDPVHAGGPQVDPRVDVQAAAAVFLRAIYVLLRATALYRKDHPRVSEGLDEAERALRQALKHSSPFAFQVDRGQVALVAPAQSGSSEWPANFRSECDALAQELERRGVSSIVFEPETSRSDLDALAQLLHPRSLRRSARQNRSWQSLLAAQSIRSIRINVAVEHKTEAALAALLAALLSYGGSVTEEAELGSGRGGRAAIEPRSEGELLAALRVLARLAPLYYPGWENSPRECATALHGALGSADRRSIALLAQTIRREAPRPSESPRIYLLRLGETLALEFASRELMSRRLEVSALRPTLARLAEGAAGILRASQTAGAKAAIFADWAEESYVERLYERLWEGLPGRDIIRVLDCDDAWTVPVGILRRTVEQLAGAKDAESRREARALLVNYTRCLTSENGKARRAVAAGLNELQPQIERLWPAELPAEFTDCVLRALVAETSPGTAGLLAAATQNIARYALAIADYSSFERIVSALERGPRDAEHAHLIALAARITGGEDWLTMVDVGLSHKLLDGNSLARSSESALPRLLRRDPERVLERLGLLLTTPNGFDSVPAMARLIRSIGEAATGSLEAHLSDPRHQRAATAVKLLAAAEPERLLAAMTRVFPSWDWSLQDLAVSELSRPAHREPPPGLARVFVSLLPEAHSMVAPVLLDLIGQEREASAVPLLLEIAAGAHERLRDVFLRIKAVEALGRLGAPESAELLRGMLRQRNGLTHAEPAGLRAAAEEALALVENRPSSARVRMTWDALEKAGADYLRPRRYLRIPLTAPLHARIEGSPGTAARVRTISLGGAFLESRGRLAVGDSLRVEIRSGLRRLRATAVVRNVAGDGGGVEFIHMKADDRERLRRLVQRYAGE